MLFIFRRGSADCPAPVLMLSVKAFACLSSLWQSSNIGEEYQNLSITLSVTQPSYVLSSLQQSSNIGEEDEESTVGKAGPQSGEPTSVSLTTRLQWCHTCTAMSDTNSVSPADKHRLASWLWDELAIRVLWILVCDCDCESWIGRK